MLLGTRGHLGARLGRAELAQRSIDEVDAVEKVDHCRSHVSGQDLSPPPHCIVSYRERPATRWGRRPAAA